MYLRSHSSNLPERYGSSRPCTSQSTNSFPCHTYKFTLPQVLSLPHIRKTWGVGVHVVKQTTYLSLGSNVGERAKNLRDAVAALGSAGIQVVRVSSVYETEPVDYSDQAWFLNMALEVETESGALELLRTLRQIETQMGSKKLMAKGPRLIDMDILLYGDQVIDTPELQVPHPRMHLRRFVLEPLAEIAPNVRHPVSGQSATEMLARTSDKSVVRKFDDSSSGRR
jgi:2-amino-4-hydroxy-6-hydroxymethyldihydropteridine diphosphokinase